MRRINQTYLRPQRMEKESLVMNLTLKPWYCDEARNRSPSIGSDVWLDTRCVPSRATQVTVHNKVRDQFSMLVNAGLTVLGLNFDSLASIILPNFNSTECLNSRLRCCNVTRDAFGSVLQSQGSTDCLRQDKWVNEDCST
jgi:hypothetical protein